MAGALLESGIIKQAGARTSQWANNLGFVAATTSVAADSIKITGHDGNALSVANQGWIVVPDEISGLLQTFSLTADVTIDLTGAHWGFGTLGDLTDFFLRLYAINDAGTLKWGVSIRSGLKTILNTDDTATATSATSAEKVLVNTALGADAEARELMYFKAAFDDTGGSSEDLWTIATGAGDIRHDIPVPIMTPWKTFAMTIGGSTTAPTKATTTIADLAAWRRVGSNMEVIYTYRHTDNTGSAAGSGTYLFLLPESASIDSAIVDIRIDERSTGSLGQASTSGSNILDGFVKAYDANNLAMIAGDDAVGWQYIDSAFGPLTGAEVNITFSASVPISGWGVYDGW